MNILSQPIEFNKKKIDGNYRLVIVAIERAKELAQGTQPEIASKATKITTIAIEEATSGALNILTGKGAVKAREKAKKISHKRMIDEAHKIEDMTEIERDLKVYLTEKGERDSKKTIEDVFGDRSK